MKKIEMLSSKRLKWVIATLSVNYRLFIYCCHSLPKQPT
jgi:hypothetical protein